jgi:hypothetical protein
MLGEKALEIKTITHKMFPWNIKSEKKTLKKMLSFLISNVKSIPSGFMLERTIVEMGEKF